MKKAIIIPVVILIVAAAAIFGAFQAGLLPLGNTNDTVENVVVDNENAENVVETQEATPSNNAVPNEYINEDEMVEDITDTTSQQQTQFGDETAEQEFSDNIASQILDTSHSSEAFQQFSSTVPTIFSVPSNLIKGDGNNGDLGRLFTYEAYMNPTVNTNTKIQTYNPRYIRHALTTTAYSAGGRGPQGENFEAGRPIMHYMDQVVDVQEGKLVYLGFRPMSPAHVPMVEEQHHLIRETIQASLDNESPALDIPSLRAKLLALYSYSYYIESDYMNTIAGLMDYSNVSEDMSEDNIVRAMMTNWRPSQDGSGTRVISLGVPSRIATGNGYEAYTCSITYRTDHDNPSIKDQDIETTLNFAVDSKTGKFLSIQEKEGARITSVPDNRMHDDKNLEYNPTIEMILTSTGEN